ncbi:hypothetical protein [Lysinibacillus xylanilyticus]
MRFYNVKEKHSDYRDLTDIKGFFDLAEQFTELPERNLGLPEQFAK